MPSNNSLILEGIFFFGGKYPFLSPFVCEAVNGVFSERKKRPYFPSMLAPRWKYRHTLNCQLRSKEPQPEESENVKKRIILETHHNENPPCHMIRSCNIDFSNFYKNKSKNLKKFKNIVIHTMTYRT